MNRSIIDFFRDDVGDWAARLDCGHAQHTRNNPPFVNRPWVETPAGRERMVGEVLDCLKCERLELPPEAESYSRTPEFDASSTPAGLRSEHSTKTGVWGRINVLQGELGYVTLGQEQQKFTLTPDSPGIIAPEMVHFVQPETSSSVRFYVEFLRVPKPGR